MSQSDTTWFFSTDYFENFTNLLFIYLLRILRTTIKARILFPGNMMLAYYKIFRFLKGAKTCEVIIEVR